MFQVIRAQRFVDMTLTLRDVFHALTEKTKKSGLLKVRRSGRGTNYPISIRKIVNINYCPGEIFSMRTFLIADILTFLHRRNFCTIFPENRVEITTIQDGQNVCIQNAHRQYLKYFEKNIQIIPENEVHVHNGIYVAFI